MTQVEDDYKEKLGKETLAKSDLEMVYLGIIFCTQFSGFCEWIVVEIWTLFCFLFSLQEVANLKQKIQKCELDLENSRKSGEMSLVPFTNIAAEPTDLSDTPMKEMYGF